MNLEKIENDKRILLNDLINATREVISKFSGSKKIVTEDEEEIQNLIKCWENALKNGLKNSLLSNVQELFSNAINNYSNIQSNKSSNGSMFWSFASRYLSPDELMRFNNFKNLWTDKGRTKALIRSALNEGCLERYVLTWINADNIREFYDSHALLRDGKAEILPKLAHDISNILFAIKLDVPELNVSNSYKPVVMVEPVIESGSKSSITKPKKVNQIDSFEETSVAKKKDTDIASLPKLNLENTQLLVSFNESTNSQVDRISISTETSSQSNFYDAKDNDEDDLVSNFHSSSSSEGDENEMINEPLNKRSNELEKTKITAEIEHKIEFESTIRKQNDRIKELEQQILDLTVENSRLRQLLNANKVNTAANFQVSIPRAVLKKSKTKTNYYVYEINLRSTNGVENWTVFKRYRDFYKLHKELKKQHIQIKVLDFPPKKKIGNMDFNVVEDRRQRLQVYIRHVLQNLPDLQVETRSLLETKCPFFKT